MTANQHLVPTPIVDKNGVSSTRLKKPTPGSSRRSLMPAPSVASTMLVDDERDALTARAVEQAADMLGVFDDSGLDSISSNIKSYSIGFMRTLIPMLESQETIAFGVAHQIFMSTPETRIKETIHFCPLLNTKVCSRVAASLEALRAYEQLPMYDDLSLADEEMQEHYVALIKVAEAYGRYEGEHRRFADDGKPIAHIETSNWTKAPYLADDRLIRLVLTRPADADRIVEIITERGITESENIQTILDWDAPSLAEGHL